MHPVGFPPPTRSPDPSDLPSAVQVVCRKEWGGGGATVSVVGVCGWLCVFLAVDGPALRGTAVGQGGQGAAAGCLVAAAPRRAKRRGVTPAPRVRACMWRGHTHRRVGSAAAAALSGTEREKGKVGQTPHLWTPSLGAAWGPFSSTRNLTWFADPGRVCTICKNC